MSRLGILLTSTVLALTPLVAIAAPNVITDWDEKAATTIQGNVPAAPRVASGCNPDHGCHCTLPCSRQSMALRGSTHHTRVRLRLIQAVRSRPLGNGGCQGADQDAP